MKNITAERYTNGKPNLRRFHQARWDEPVIFELGQPGQRGILSPQAGAEIKSQLGDPLEGIPAALRRKNPPKLPEMSQPAVLRHYVHLSQENLGADFNIDVGQGTCTMKYSPKVNDQLARMPEMTELHPLQDESSVQGILEIMYRFEAILKEISGLDRFTLQPGAGSAAIYTNISILRAYHASRGESKQRDEIITTIFSHPSNAAAAKVAGFKVITLYPDPDGYPDLEALKAAVSERTAGLLITNPEDTGIFNPKIAEFTRVVHKAGGLCSYDQANANGILGITRAREAGFDLCHFNLHKTFSTPHGGGGPGSGPVGVKEKLVPFLPVPIVAERNGAFFLDADRPLSIGRLHPYLGNVGIILRAFAYMRSLGSEGLPRVSRAAIVNANYLMRKIEKDFPVAYPGTCMHEFVVSCSWMKKYGVKNIDVAKRLLDYGVHAPTVSFPLIVPDCLMIEPTESESRSSLDSFAEILRDIAREVREEPQTVIDAPHDTPVRRLDEARAARNLVVRWSPGEKRDGP